MMNLVNIAAQTPSFALVGTLFLLMLAMFANIFLDVTQIRENREIDYSFHNRLIGGVMIAILGAGFAMNLPLKVVFSIAVMIPATRWAVHDLGLNLARGLPLGYLGNRAKTDIFLRLIDDSLGLPPAIVRGAAFSLSFSVALNILMI